jgi:hypothetical protein
MSTHQAKAKLHDLMQPIARNTQRVAEIKRLGKTASTQDQQEFMSHKQQIAHYRSENRLAIDYTTANLYLSHLRNLSEDELLDQSLTIGKGGVKLQKAFRHLANHFAEDTSFLADLKRIEGLVADFSKQELGDERVSKNVLTLTDRVDFDTYFTIGADPVPSCQHYLNGDYNEGLLSLVVDPSVKILQMHNSSGQLIARAVLRLMKNEQEEPVLFLERTYSVNMHPNIARAFAGLAKEKAKEMRVQVYGAEMANSNDNSFPKNGPMMLYGTNGRAPYVYSDAGGGLSRSARLILQVR